MKIIKTTKLHTYIEKIKKKKNAILKSKKRENYNKYVNAVINIC